MKHYEYEISQFIDNELKVNEQRELFAHLAVCGECRVVLADSMEIKKDLKNHYINMETNVPASTLINSNAFKISKSKKYLRLSFAASAAAVLVLGFLLYGAQVNIQKIENKCYSLISEVDLLKKENNIIKSSAKITVMPKRKAQPVKKKTVLFVSKKEINVAVKKDTSSVKNIIKYVRSIPYDQYASVQVINLTRENFLVKPMVGN